MAKWIWKKLADENDVIFMALPHGVASKVVTESVLSKAKVIDFGADFRIKDADIYEKMVRSKTRRQRTS